MLQFTTTEPGFMGSAGSGPFVARREPVVKGKWRSVYIHGDAERYAGYDVPCIVDGVLEYKPEQECLLLLKNGVEIECILVAWYAECGTMPDPKDEVIRGLICSKDDADSLAYARKCSVERKSFL